MTTTNKSAIILCSGGLDSTTVMAMAKNEGYSLYSLSFRYGQRHETELRQARKVSDLFKVEKQMIIDLDFAKIGGSALTDKTDIPKNRNLEEASKEIPATYVPARNTVFLSYALAWAEVLEISDIFIGVNAVDYSGYPDCRPEYIRAFEAMARLATRAGVEGRKIKIRVPLIQMTKAEIIKKGISLGIDYSITHSCYDPSAEGMACGNCDSCRLRLKGFREAGLADPAGYSD